ncbi:glycoside hydrolase family 18 protein [Rhizosphaericola mali]|uniref:chitinase n=1 Tax=Rhizosphaericola mali TaxID=2545455 RepID=A0A5P2G3K6_9BACT|nr:glycoside hydrolase family 18 protein [Rhizosphaericola mali]QES87673.1 glycoside hydrolase family 18 protein [Rhizosphaericola mali]
MKLKHLLFAAIGMTITQISMAQKPKIIAYYTGDKNLIDKYDVNELDEIIFSFGHLKNNKFHIENAKDSATIKHLVELKKTHPKLKILLSMGGWSACAPCSEGFSTPNGRESFANSVKEISEYFHSDGIDLDWEYPTIQGFPGHKFQAADKPNFTSLIETLRQTLGNSYQISFAAGGFQSYLDSSVEWKKIMPMVDNVNIMSYDLVNGYSTVTGHHTPLFSTKAKEESVDNAVQYLLKLGIPADKLVIGAAFYTRTWKDVPNIQNGLYQKGLPTDGADFQHYDTKLTTANGWKYYWDKKAQAPYWYNADKKLFASGDDLASVKAKTEYVKKYHLGGIMFWELVLDKPKNGMVQEMYNVINK